MNRLASNVFIHPSAVLGENNIIGYGVVIEENVKIGNNNIIYPYSVIGTHAEHHEYWGKDPGPVVIGNHNIIREFTTINAATNGITKIGDRCVMLRGSHLSHDSILEDNVTVSCSVMIGGESIIMVGANLGLGAVIHQRQIIGSYCMIGMGAVVTKKLNCTPGNIYAGNPAKFIKQNIVGLRRLRISDDEVVAEIKRFIELRNKNDQP